MLLWTGFLAYLFAEGSGETDRSPTVNAMRNSAMSVLEMSKPQGKGTPYLRRGGQPQIQAVEKKCRSDR